MHGGNDIVDQEWKSYISYFGLTKNMFSFWLAHASPKIVCITSFFFIFAIGTSLASISFLKIQNILKIKEVMDD